MDTGFLLLTMTLSWAETQIEFRTEWRDSEIRTVKHSSPICMCNSWINASRFEKFDMDWIQRKLYKNGNYIRGA